MDLWLHDVAYRFANVLDKSAAYTCRAKWQKANQILIFVVLDTETT
jgi:hypothetical protein